MNYAYKKFVTMSLTMNQTVCHKLKRKTKKIVNRDYKHKESNGNL